MLVFTLRRIASALLIALALPVVAQDAKPAESKSADSKATTPTKVIREDFGKTADGKAVEIFTLTNAGGAKARIMTYGATLVSLEVPGKDGKTADVVLGFDSLAEYEKGSAYFGCTVGRYANRIGGAKFSLDGTEYTLHKNDGENSLHGGKRGFDRAVWSAEIIQRKQTGGVKFTYTSPDGEEGYPGTLKTTVTYLLGPKNNLRIRYEAETDKKTVVNLTHHSYFNLAGAGEGDILGHELTLLADQFTPVDKTLIPTGELRPVKDTPLDFTTATAIGARIDAEDEQIALGQGYDHNYVLRAPASSGKPLRAAAKVRHAGSGRIMEVATTEPGLQFYTGNFLDGVKGKGGKVYPRRGAFCLEAQRFPDTPNKPSFPTATLEPGKKYTQTTVYGFSVE